MADISNIQRDLANTQKQIKQIADQAKKETDPKRKADLQKKLVDLNLQRTELDKEMEDAVSNLHAGVEFSLENKVIKRRKKLTESDRGLVKKYIKKLIQNK